MIDISFDMVIRASVMALISPKRMVLLRARMAVGLSL